MWNLEMQGNMTVTLEMTTPLQFSMSKPSDKYEIKQEGKTAKLIIHDVEPGDAGKYDFDTGDDHTSAVFNVKEAPVLIKEHLEDKEADEFGSATLTCQLSKPAVEVAWKKDSTILQPSDKYEIKQEGKIAKLIIHDVEPGDAGQYGCDTKDDHTCAFLKVKEAPVKISEGLVDQEADEFGSATLTCQLSKPAVQIAWKKDSTLLQPSDKYKIKQEGKTAKLIIHDVELGDAGKYDCDIGDDHTSAVLNVKEAPILIKEHLEDKEADEFGSATLTCQLSKPAVEVAWKKDSTLLQPSDKYEIKQEGKTAKLIIHDVEPGDAGKYDFDTGDDHTSAVLNVKEAPILIKEHLEDKEADEFGSATLTCQLSKPAVEVAWKKDSTLLQPSDKYEIKQEGKTAKLIIHDVEPGDAGQYGCDTKDDHTCAVLKVKEAPVKISEGLVDQEADEFGSATLTCQLSKPAVEVAWKKDSTLLQPSDKYEIKQEGKTAKLIIHDVEPGDAGKYDFDTGDDHTSAVLNVKVLDIKGQVKRMEMLKLENHPFS
ncbi:obscurin-like [Lampetra fluviatilis]